MSVSVDSTWCFAITPVIQSQGCYWHLLFVVRSFHWEDRLLKRGDDRLNDYLSHDKSTQTSLFKPSCQCMHHFPLIALCTVMFPPAGEEKIDAVIFSNGFSAITAAGAHSHTGPRKANESQD